MPSTVPAAPMRKATKVLAAVLQSLWREGARRWRMLGRLPAPAAAAAASTPWSAGAACITSQEL